VFCTTAKGRGYDINHPRRDADINAGIFHISKEHFMSKTPSRAASPVLPRRCRHGHVVALVLPALAQLPVAQAGCCDNVLNTATGVNALYSNTTGYSNTATGFVSMYRNTTGYSNTATGAYVLHESTSGFENAAHGFRALELNSTGSRNTASGAFALNGNGPGSNNTAIGFMSLSNNFSGSENTAAGNNALYANTTGYFNTANGAEALYSNTTGYNNTANGVSALLSNLTGNNNTAYGYGALANVTGSRNIALGSNAGTNLTRGSNNIDIGNSGVAGESKTIRIGTQGAQTKTYLAGIYGTTVAGGVSVVVASNGRLGTVTSSARFKDDIEPMDNTSEAILALQPVSFHYKKSLDPQGIPQYGLIAEQVAKVDPNLVVRDVDGSAYTVRYDAVNAMLLNEFLKEHRKVAELSQSVAATQAAMQTMQQQIRELVTTVQEQATLIKTLRADSGVANDAPLLLVNNR
jgi:hypothetical protein